MCMRCRVVKAEIRMSTAAAAENRSQRRRARIRFSRPFYFSVEPGERTEDVGRRHVPLLPFAFPFAHQGGVFRRGGEESEEFALFFGGDGSFEIADGEFFQAFVHGVGLLYAYIHTTIGADFTPPRFRKKSHIF